MTKKNLALLSAFTLLFALTTTVFSGEHPSKDDVVKFVGQGLAYAKTHGKDAFFKEVMNPSGEFIKGELYIYAYDYDGNVLAHGAKPHLVGKNLINMADKNGNKLIRELIKAAKDGTGWVEYFWQNPTTKKIEKKLGYAVNLDGISWFGSGTYSE